MAYNDGKHKVGDKVWVYAFDRLGGKHGKFHNIKPTLGLILGRNGLSGIDQDMGSYSFNNILLYKVKNDKQTDELSSKTVEIRKIYMAESYEEALENYNKQVQKALDFYQSKVEQVKGYIIEEQSSCEESEFLVSVESDRCKYNIYDTEELSETSGVEFGHNRLYYVDIKLDSIDNDCNKIDRVADMQLIIMHYNCDSSECMIYDADALGGDEQRYASYLANSKEFNREEIDYDFYQINMEDEAFEDIVLVNGAIHRLYINPKYRRHGIGSKLLDNVDKILERALGLRLRSTVMLVKPDKGQANNMKDVMIKLVKNVGFRHIGEDYYIKDYMEEYYIGQD